MSIQGALNLVGRSALESAQIPHHEIRVPGAVVHFDPETVFEHALDFETVEAKKSTGEVWLQSAAAITVKTCLDVLEHSLDQERDI